MHVLWNMGMPYVAVSDDVAHLVNIYIYLEFVLYINLCIFGPSRSWISVHTVVDSCLIQNIYFCPL